MIDTSILISISFRDQRLYIQADHVFIVHVLKQSFIEIPTGQLPNLPQAVNSCCYYCALVLTHERKVQYTLCQIEATIALVTRVEISCILDDAEALWSTTKCQIPARSGSSQRQYEVYEDKSTTTVLEVDPPKFDNITA